MWDSKGWIFIDFEVFGIAGAPESIKPGILGMVVETPETSTYLCFILDPELEPLSQIYPDYTVYNPTMNLNMILHHINQLDPDKTCKYLFSWSDNDVVWLKRFFGDICEVSELRTINALPDTRRQGRAKWEMRIPHSLSRYMDKANYNYPKNVVPTKLMSELKTSWKANPNNFDENIKQKAFDLLRYNYHDCFGMRTVMRILDGHTNIPDGDGFFSC